MAKMDAMDMHNRLAGATVVVTRPAASAGAIKRRVRQLGGNGARFARHDAAKNRRRESR